MATRGDVQTEMALGVSGVVMMTMEEARACVERVKSGIEQMRRDLLELREREGWKALGYQSWRACAVAEFGVGLATVYRQLEAAAIERDLSQVAEFLPKLRTMFYSANKKLTLFRFLTSRLRFGYVSRTDGRW